MSLPSKKVAVISSNPQDHDVWRQAFDYYPEKLEIEFFNTAPSHPENFGYVLQLTNEKMRIGSILDHIDSKIMGMSREDVLHQKNYTLMWQNNLLKIDDKTIELTDRETEIIYLLLSCNNSECTRDDLLNQVWGYRNDLETHTLETHIYRLRQKIENDPAKPQKLITIENGYALV